ncbi:MAG: hypothetical protein ABIT36_01430 [Steroidobacteraceae bacterium]
MKRLLVCVALFAIVLAVLASAGGPGFWKLYITALTRGTAQFQPADYQPRESLRGGDGGGLPRAEPAAEGIEVEALQAAQLWSADADADALLVMRHGHLVYEHYFRGEAGTLVDSGRFATLLHAMAAGSAVRGGLVSSDMALEAFGPIDAVGSWRNPWSRAAHESFGSAVTPEPLRAVTGKRYSQYVAAKIWAPLNAGDAHLWLDSGRDAVRVDCCVLARPVDWLRVARLVLDAGALDGEAVVQPAWVARMLGSPALSLTPGDRARGPEPYATHGVFHVAGAGESRLWLVPRLQLAILSIAQHGTLTGDDTSLPNLILRGMPRRANDGALRADRPNINDLVPAH